MKNQRIPLSIKWWVALILVVALPAWVGIARSESSLDTQLIRAAAGGKVESVKFLLDQGADPNRKGYKGITALIAVAGGGLKEKFVLDVARLLLAKGADVNAKDNCGWTPLTHAAWGYDRKLMVKLLREHGAEPTLTSAACLGDLEQVQRLLKAGASVNAKGRSGGTALMGAAREGHAEIVKLLLDQGADVTAKTAQNSNALLYAASYGHTDIAELLLKKGADVNSRDVGGTTALILAVSGAPSQSMIDMVKLLLDHGARVNDTDDFDYSALKAAVHRGYWDVVMVLLAHGAYSNTTIVLTVLGLALFFIIRWDSRKSISNTARTSMPRTGKGA